jgi:hypothetical protein
MAAARYGAAVSARGYKIPIACHASPHENLRCYGMGPRIKVIREVSLEGLTAPC